MHHDDDDHDRGLAHDLRTMVARIDRRQVLRWMAAASVLPLVANCMDDGGGEASPDGGTTANPDAGTSASCSNIPEETAGPYPGDGSNGPNALSLTGIVRSDIRSSIGGLTGTAEGVPLTVELTLIDTAADCAPLAGYAIYLWHCDRDGQYSLYTVTDQNYLRGVQETDANGTVTFTTIFPACYSGRMPHIHFEVYASLASATGSGNKVHTSQLAFPTDVCNTAYATSGYEQSVTNLSQISFATDNVFSDGTSLQMATVSGSVAAGYVATLTVGIAG